MIDPVVQQHIVELVQQKTGSAIHTLRFYPVGGGSINDTYRVETNTSELFFCKLNSGSKFPGLFKAEQQGLELLHTQGMIRVPKVIGSGMAGDKQVLVLEWIEQGMRTPGFWKLFGQQLAALHSVRGELFGLDADNYMGALVQHNRQSGDWNEFFIHQRLGPQLKLALDAGLLAKQHIQQFEKLYRRLPQIFPAEPPGLLHGDLWSGNFLCDNNSRPVLIDPAVYYGHWAVDMAMTTLFGGFDSVFYDSYSHYRQFAPNYHEQWEVCNLYPLLIHLNLFGESYKAGILHTISRY
jgi:protein-ribulosamine 3-kinase